MSQSTMQDPRAQYAQPPFDKQPQDAPGLAKDMKPKPDHGEDSYVGSGRLAGRKALITGGDSGIGRAVAIAYVREGASVVINYLESEESDVQEVLGLLTSEGGTISAIPGDITDESFCESLVDSAAEALGGLDILVNVAGKQVAVEKLEDISTEQFDATFKTNVYAMFWITKRALKYLKAGASIINTSSLVGFHAEPNLVDYSATKAADKSFTESLGQQLLTDRGIRVNAVAPGPFWTPLQTSGGQPQDKITEFGKEDTPMGRPGQPAEIQGIYVFLASQESGYISAQTYGVTGGAPTA